MTSPFEPFERPPAYAPDPYAHPPHTHPSHAHPPYPHPSHAHPPYPHPPHAHTPSPEPDGSLAVERLGAERHSKVLRVAAAVVGFYLLNALLTNVAGGLMAVRLVGHLNLGLALALLQCATTLLVCRWYARYARTTLDPLAERVRAGRAPQGGHR